MIFFPYKETRFYFFFYFPCSRYLSELYINLFLSLYSVVVLYISRSPSYIKGPILLLGDTLEVRFELSSCRVSRASL